MNITPSQAERMERRRLDSARARTSTTAATRPMLLPCLPAALRRLISVLQQRLERPGLSEQQQEAWTKLIVELEVLVGLQPLRHHFERAVSACHVARFHDTEGYLEFLYAATYDVLTDYTARWLRAQRIQEDAESAAVDLVSQLFLELADTLFDGDLSPRGVDSDAVPGRSELESRLPVPGRVLPWLLRALKHDVLDRAKAATNRLTRATPEQPMEVLSARIPLGMEPECSDLSPLELAERREAFLSAFGRATLHLKPQHQRVLFLREVESLKPEVIAEKLGLTRQQVVDQLQYGREKRADLLLTQLIRHPATRDLEADAGRLKRLLSRVSLSPLAAALAAPPGLAEPSDPSASVGRAGSARTSAQYILGGLEPSGAQKVHGVLGEPGRRPLASQCSGESPPEAHRRGWMACGVQQVLEPGSERTFARGLASVSPDEPSSNPVAPAELVPLSVQACAKLARKAGKR